MQRDALIGGLLVGASYVWALGFAAVIAWAGYTGYQEAGWRGAVGSVTPFDTVNMSVMLVMVAPGVWMNFKGHDLRRRAASRSRRP